MSTPSSTSNAGRKGAGKRSWSADARSPAPPATPGAAESMPPPPMFPSWVKPTSNVDKDQDTSAKMMETTPIMQATQASQAELLRFLISPSQAKPSQQASSASSLVENEKIQRAIYGILPSFRVNDPETFVNKVVELAGDPKYEMYSSQLLSQLKLKLEDNAAYTLVSTAESFKEAASRLKERYERSRVTKIGEGMMLLGRWSPKPGSKPMEQAQSFEDLLMTAEGKCVLACMQDHTPVCALWLELSACNKGLLRANLLH
jgi:hypothetical protein